MGGAERKEARPLWLLGMTQKERSKVDIEQSLLDHLESKGWILDSYEDGAVAFSHGDRITYTIKQGAGRRSHAMVIKSVGRIASPF
jgi:hypothetical protein